MPHVAIVFTRYMMFFVVNRCNEDDKTICELFYCLMDELDDINFSQSMQSILEALLDTTREFVYISQKRSWKNLHLVLLIILCQM